MSPSKLDPHQKARDFRTTKRKHKRHNEKPPLPVHVDVTSVTYASQLVDDGSRFTVLDALPEMGEDWINEIVHVRGQAGAPDRLYLGVQLLDDSLTWLELSLLVAPNQGTEQNTATSWTWLRHITTNDPYAAVAHTSGDVYITSPTGSASNPKIRRFTSTGSLVIEAGVVSATGASTSGGTQTGPQGPFSIAYNPLDTRLWVGRNGGGTGNGPKLDIWKTVADGGSSGPHTIQTQAFISPVGGGSTGDDLEEGFEQVAVGGGRAWIADKNNHQIVSGLAISTWGSTPARHGSSGSGDGQFNVPNGVVYHDDGFVFVGDSGNNRIQKFSISGSGSSTTLTYVAQWGSVGTGTSQFATGGIRHLAVDAQGLLHVVDGGNNRIQVFDVNGTYVGFYGAGGAGNGQLAAPVGIAINPDGVIYVNDRGNGRISLWVAA